MRRFLLPLLVLGLLPATVARPDEVWLKGGSHLEGVVLGRSEQGVRLLLPPGAELRLAAADVAEVKIDADAPQAGRHLRYREPDPKSGKDPGGGLEVAVTHFVHPQGGPRVDLVGTVHIADPAFYREVQRVLEAAEVVLYEGVKPRDASAAEFEKAQAEPNPVRDLQQKMATWFGLAFQLDGIAYTRPHFVHADLTAEEFLEASGGDAKSAGAAAGGLMGNVEMVRSLMKLAGPLIDMLMGKEERSGPLRGMLKKQFARALGSVDLEKAMGQLSPDAAELLLTRRNAVVIERLREQRAKARGAIAILYGAGHLPALERAITGELGYRRAGARWLRAWAVE